MQKYEDYQSPVDCQTFHPACDVNYISNKLTYLITNEIYKKNWMSFLPIIFGLQIDLMSTSTSVD